MTTLTPTGGRLVGVGALLGLLIFVAGFFSILYVDENQPLILCIPSDNSCREILKKEIPVADVSGECITVSGKGVLCRPEYVLFQEDLFLKGARASCTKLKGTFQGWNTCVIDGTVWQLDPIAQKWEKVTNNL